MGELTFVKMHGLGNDYVVLGVDRDPDGLPTDVLVDRARTISDRRRGVGSDGLILVGVPRDSAADIAMRMFNSDGSEAEMCGNGIRCVARFARERLGLSREPMAIRTAAGIRACRVQAGASGCEPWWVDVDMGSARFGPAAVGANVSMLRPGASSIQAEFVVGSRSLTVALVSVGNPHAVVFGPLDLDRDGPVIERGPAFPARINVHEARIESRTSVRVATWERGSGRTMACGTGACAVVAAGVVLDLLEAECDVWVPGGRLRVASAGDRGSTWLGGPAETAFEGRLAVESTIESRDVAQVSDGW